MKDLVIGLFFAALGIVVLFMAQDFPSISGLKYGAGLFPSLIGIGLILAGLFLAAGAARQVIKSGAAEGGSLRFARPSLQGLTPLIPCVMVVGYMLLSETVGSTLYLMIAMFILFCLRGTRVLTALLIAIGFSLLISVAFTYLLSVPLPKGPLGI